MGFCKLALVCSDIIPKYGRTNGKPREPVPQRRFSPNHYIKCQCGLYNESYYGEFVTHLAIRSGKHIGISPLTNKSLQPRKYSAACHHLLNCNYSPIFEDLVFCVTRIRSTF